MLYLYFSSVQIKISAEYNFMIFNKIIALLLKIIFIKNTAKSLESLKNLNNNEKIYGKTLTEKLGHDHKIRSNSSLETRLVHKNDAILDQKSPIQSTQNKQHCSSEIEDFFQQIVQLKKSLDTSNNLSKLIVYSPILEFQLSKFKNLNINLNIRYTNGSDTSKRYQPLRILVSFNSNVETILYHVLNLYQIEELDVGKYFFKIHGLEEYLPLNACIAELKYFYDCINENREPVLILVDLQNENTRLEESIQMQHDFSLDNLNVHFILDFLNEKEPLISSSIDYGYSIGNSPDFLKIDLIKSIKSQIEKINNHVFLFIKCARQSFYSDLNVDLIGSELAFGNQHKENKNTVEIIQADSKLVIYFKGISRLDSLINKFYSNNNSPLGLYLKFSIVYGLNILDTVHMRLDKIDRNSQKKVDFFIKTIKIQFDRMDLCILPREACLLVELFVTNIPNPNYGNMFNLFNEKASDKYPVVSSSNSAFQNHDGDRCVAWASKSLFDQKLDLNNQFNIESRKSIAKSQRKFSRFEKKFRSVNNKTNCTLN
ncbi:hypothetical protein BpHYR1_010132 [Brachionus plicatilis]|uniref:PI3K-RBD domain-containing protein n=1 Tax=Brachionus plicatilis TaxID=10195 RepID=A0A3M7R971_BRAPC|nr:hypothetical protein BpHYR1_010132 [Brachionus plicatilis]